KDTILKINECKIFHRFLCRRKQNSYIMNKKMYWRILNMKYFIDTVNMDEIKEIHEWGVLSDVTTNPSLVAKEKDISFHERLVEICELVQGPDSGEVISLEAEGMIEEGRELAKLHEYIIV